MGASGTGLSHTRSWPAAHAHTQSATKQVNPPTHTQAGRSLTGSAIGPACLFLSMDGKGIWTCSVAAGDVATHLPEVSAAPIRIPQPTHPSTKYQVHRIHASVHPSIVTCPTGLPLPCEGHVRCGTDGIEGARLGQIALSAHTRQHGLHT